MAARVLRAFYLTRRVSPLLATSSVSFMSTTASDAVAEHSGHAFMGPVTVRTLHSDKTWRFEGSTLANASPTYPWAEIVSEDSKSSMVTILSERVPRADDAEALLDRLQEGVASSSVDASCSFPVLASLLRASAPTALDVPQTYDSAKAELTRRFASGPHDTVLAEDVPHVEEALALSRAHGIKEIQTGLFYSFVTTAHFEDDTHITPPSVDSADPSLPPRCSLLAPADLSLAHTIQEKLLEFFSPTLFQAPPASHMECTDAIADTWLSLVIPCAMAPAEEGQDERTRLSRELDLGRPLETLHALEAADWEARGVCKECAEGRRQECREEREAIWDKIRDWLTSS